MAFATSGAHSFGYSGSALRYGLVDIKPIKVVENIKRLGLKFRRVTRTFESLQPSKSYADLVTFENEKIFGTVEIPKWFEAEKLVKTLSQYSIQNYEKDTELKDAVKNIRESERKGRPLVSFAQFMKNRFESKRDYYVEVEAERFLNSNFPLSFYNKLVVFDNTYYAFLKILEDTVRLYEFRASVSRSFDLYKKRFNEIKRRIIPALDQMDSCWFSYDRLKKYLLIWNSKDYEEIFNPKFLDMKNVSSPEFGEICKDYDRKLIETRQFLLGYSPEYLHKELDSDETTKKMFSKLIMLPSSSLNLGTLSSR